MFLDHAIKTIAILPSGLIMAYMLSQLLHPIHPARFIAAMTAIPSALYLIYGVFSSYPGVRPVYLFVQFALCIALPLILGQESISRRALAIGIYYLITFSSELLCASFFLRAGGTVDAQMTPLATQTPGLFLLMETFTFVTNVALCFICLWLWKRFILKVPVRFLWYYALFPASQAVILFLALSFANLSNSHIASHYFLLSLAMLFCALTDTLLFRSMDQLTKRALAEERAIWSESLLFQQQSYYTQILADAEDASRIRHDIRNQLQTAYTLMSQGDTAAAREQLDGIAQSLSSAPAFCPHRVVNAILTIKASRFSEAGIPFNCRCDLPGELPIKGVELCSLFSNVLDNAYRAAVNCPRTTDRTVCLSAAVEGGFLILSCSNPLPAQPQPQRGRGHGLGLGILEDLARRHGGELKTEQTGGVFKTTVWLQLESSKTGSD